MLLIAHLLGVEAPLRAEVAPAAEVGALLGVFAVPGGRRHDLHRNLGELGRVGGAVARLGIAESLRVVVVDVRETALLELHGELPCDFRLVGLGIPQGRDHRLLHRDVAVEALARLHEAPALEHIMLRGKQDVGEHGGLRRHRRDVHVERHLRVRLVETLHAGGAEAVVAPVADEHLDLIAAVLVVPVFLQDDVSKPARRLVGVDRLAVVVQKVLADAPVDRLHLGGLAGVAVAEVVVVGKACRRGRSASEHAALRLDGTDQAVERVRRHGAVHATDLHVRTRRLP